MKNLLENLPQAIFTDESNALERSINTRYKSRCCTPNASCIWLVAKTIPYYPDCSKAAPTLWDDMILKSMIAKTTEQNSCWNFASS